VAEIWGNHVIGIEEKPTIRNPILLCTAVIHVNSDRFIDSAGSSSTSASEFLNQ
jgi:hypothetical protein